MNELTDVCESNAGWIYWNPPPPVSACDTTFHYEIVAILTADGTPSLEGLNTTSRAITCTLIRIVIEVDGSDEAQSWQLDAGPADPDDPGDVEPADYDATNNDKHWTKVGG